MGWRYARWAILGGFAVMVAGAPLQDEPCGVFYLALEATPHTSLTRGVAPFEPIWPTEPAPACEVAFETDDSTLAGGTAPDFSAEPGTDLYQAGWRTIPEILADGPGSGVFGLQNASARCVVEWTQPAYIDDDGAFVQSDTLSIRIQCGASDRT